MIETLITLFSVGTIGFWVLILMSNAIFIACIENEHHVTPALIGIGLIAAYWTPLVSCLNWPIIICGIVIFILIGMVHSIFSWKRYVTNKVNELTTQNGSNVINHMDLSMLKLSLQPSRHKSRIIGWIVFWPWSMFWKVTGDFFVMIYRSLLTVYNRIVENAMSKLIPELEPEKKPYKNGSEIDKLTKYSR